MHHASGVKAPWCPWTAASHDPLGSITAERGAVLPSFRRAGRNRFDAIVVVLASAVFVSLLLILLRAPLEFNAFRDGVWTSFATEATRADQGSSFSLELGFGASSGRRSGLGSRMLGGMRTIARSKTQSFACCLLSCHEVGELRVAQASGSIPGPPPRAVAPFARLTD